MKGNSGLIGATKNPTRVSAPGRFDLFDQYSSRTADKWPLTVTYTSTASSTIYENTSQPIYIYTSNLSEDTTLYWTINHNSTTTADFSGSTSGSFVQSASSNAGLFYVATQFIGDPAKSTKSFSIQVRTSSTSGPIVYETDLISIPAIIVNSVYWSSTSINENSGSSYLYANIGNCGTNQLHSVVVTQTSGSINTGTDFSSYLSYSRTIGGANYYRYVYTAADITTEGTETFGVTMSYNGYTWGSATLTVTDSSLTPSISISNASSVTEGSSITFTITDSNGGTGTLYWTITGTASAADFSEGASGSFTLSSGNGSVTLTPLADGISESESFQLQIRSGSTSGTILGTSSSVSIVDAVAPSVTFTDIVSSGILPGGTSQMVPNYTYNMTVNPLVTAGKRYFVVLCGFRDANGAIPGYVPIITSVTVNGTAMTYQNEGTTDYNSSAIWSGFSDAAGTIPIYMSFARTTEYGTGYITLFVFDGVNSVSVTSNAVQIDTSTSSVAVNVASNGTPGSMLRVVGCNSSNSTYVPTFASSDGFAYTLQFSHDNGTSEWSSGYYYYSSTSSTAGITGTVSANGSAGPQGMAYVGAIFKFS